MHIRPEPSEQERQAIERALEQHDDEHPAYASGWRRAGVAENLGLDDGALAEESRRDAGVVEP